MASFTSNIHDNSSRVDSKIGFLDLTGELRNWIYKYHLAQRPSVSAAIALSLTCRTIRAEYRPLYFQQGVVLPYNRVQPFLEVFYAGDTSEVMPSYNCAIIGDTKGCSYRYDPAIDLKWLVTFMYKFPQVQITYIGRDEDATIRRSRHGIDIKNKGEELNELLEIVKSNQTWCQRIADFNSIHIPMERIASTDQHPGQSASPFTIEFNIKTGALDMSQWTSQTEKGKRVDMRQGSGGKTLRMLRNRLVDFGLVAPIRKHHVHIPTIFRSLGIRMYAEHENRYYMVARCVGRYEDGYVV